MNQIEIKKTEWDDQADSTDNPCHQVCRTVDNSELAELITDITIKLSIPNQLPSILDIGCGNGLVLSHFKKNFTTVYGVDFSPKMVEAAQQLIPDGKFQQGEATTLKFADDQFDRILSYSIFHYFPDEEYAINAIQEMIRVCKKGGVILIGDMLDQNYENDIKGGSNLEYEKKIPIIQRYSQWIFYDLVKLQQTVEQQGYKVEILSQSEHFKCAHYRKDLRIYT
jgi:ubiquinone/menaquinone biosynthesis C-methylase UbiE